MQCLHCQTSVPAGKRFCIACGAPVPADGTQSRQLRPDACTRCGQPLDAGKRFCSQCGAAGGELPHTSTGDGDQAGNSVEVLSTMSASQAVAVGQSGETSGKRSRLALLLIGAAFVIVSTGGAIEYLLAGSAARQAATPVAGELATQITAEKIRLMIAANSALHSEPVRVAATGHTIELSGICSSPAVRELVRRSADQAVHGEADPPLLIDNLQLAARQRAKR